MRLVTFTADSYEAREPRVGVLTGEEVVSFNSADCDPEGLSKNTGDAIGNISRALPSIFAEQKKPNPLFTLWRYPLESVRLKAPLLHPRAIRDFIAFEQHIRTLRNRRGQEVPEAWYKMPLHYRGDHNTVYGMDDIIPWPKYCKERFDFELELACVIGKQGINIPVKQAHEYIAGYMIMNDWSCRDIQQDEMQNRARPSGRILLWPKPCHILPMLSKAPTEDPRCGFM
jgi:2-keto-4-pentenoate hydratase/2-oxohepta-3-ene-1,7-dioic acid hydratase in catechol pathway